VSQPATLPIGVAVVLVIYTYVNYYLEVDCSLAWSRDAALAVHIRMAYVALVYYLLLI
jgi:hypothetical protein